MIKYITGNILESDAQALVNTVNTMGVMGKGIALQFKEAFPNNFAAYKEACKEKKIEIGKMFVTKDSNLYSGNKIIINFPTKKNWRNPSEYQYIDNGLENLISIIKEYNITSVALPPLGAGNGGLKWEKVKKIISDKLSDLDASIYVYEPTMHIIEMLKKERVKLTDARALLLYVLFDLVKNGEYVSEFSSEKICYFLQRFGAEQYLSLNFTKSFYGPYSGKVRYVLRILNGSYISGYSDMNKRPFDPLILISNTNKPIEEYIENNKKLKQIASNTTQFLKGFYSDFALELLSSVDFIANKFNTLDESFILKEIENWNPRKRTKFANKRYISIIINHLQNSYFYQ